MYKNKLEEEGTLFMKNLLAKKDRSSRTTRTLGFGLALLLAGVSVASYSKGTKPVVRKTENKSSLVQASGKLDQAKVQAKVMESVGKLPLAFEANRGQTDPQVKFLARAKGYQAFLTANTTVLRIKGADDAVLAMTLKNAQASPKIEGQDRQVGLSN